jgi:hypothetical protein
MSPAIEPAVEVKMRELIPMAETAGTIAATTPTAVQPHARNTMGRIYGKIAPTTGAIQTAIMPMQELPVKPPTPTPTLTLLLKTPAQGRDLEEKSRAQKTNEPPTVLQWSVSMMTAKPTTNLHAAVMPHGENSWKLLAKLMSKICIPSPSSPSLAAIRKELHAKHS